MFKKHVGEVSKIQAERLEQAMVTARRWSLVEFQTLLTHPVMRMLTRLVLWGTYDCEGDIKCTFRVTEDPSFADLADKVFQPETGDFVGMVHPLQLNERDKVVWSEVFSDYKLMPPFSQLGRSVYCLNEEEEILNDITRFASVTMPAQSLVFGLEKRGWTRGPVENGLFNHHSKQFIGYELTAIVTYHEGLPVGNMEHWDDQTIERLFFVEGIQNGALCSPSDAVNRRLTDVNKVVVSEVLRDLTAIVVKGKLTV